MKSPAELRARWTRQWQDADLREMRLLQAEAWPIALSIGKPPPSVLEREPERVREHVQRWRQIDSVQVHWEAVSFRAASEPVLLPLRWQLDSPSAWIEASGDAVVQAEFRRLSRLAAALDPQFQRLLIRQRHLWRERPDEEILATACFALQLAPGCAQGRPLRALAPAGWDSKFIERNRSLLTQLLDLRFEGQASELGLEALLDAPVNAEHWLLLMPLQPGLLPFALQRVRAGELATRPLAASRLLVVENEQSLHQLPELPDTVAVLGAGLNLDWLDAAWLRDRRIAYWGDIDTWGLRMLALARQRQPRLNALLMDRATFERFAAAAVAEPYPAGAAPPAELLPAERELYQYLHGLERGRLEQEFLSVEVCHAALWQWHGGSV